MKTTLPRTTIALALFAAFAPAARAADRIPQVIVVGTTPLPGVDQASEEIAAPVQGATSRDIARSGALDLGDFLNRRMGSVHVNEVTGNPFQMDVNYRGYTASPLLGNPQGISVYVDGVRMNQPFGDVVSWDLIPRAAISTIELMPGSNPLFGLNTLGGALSVRTKDGRHDAGTTVAATIGRDGRKALEFEHGGFNAQGWDWYVTGNKFREDGWRDDSPTDVRQLFGKLGWQDRATSIFPDAVPRRQFPYRQWLAGADAVGTRPRQRLHQAGPHRQPFHDAEPVRQPYPQRCAAMVRQRLCPAHRHVHVQRRHQRRLARPVGLPAQRRRTRGPAARRLHRLPGQRRHRCQHALPALALHRPGAAERRAGGKMQRRHQSHEQHAEELRAGRTTDLDHRRAAIPQCVRGRRGLRRQPYRFRPVVATGLREPRPQHHRRGCVRRWCHRRRCRRRTVRHAGRPAWPHAHVERVCHRYAVAE